VSLSPETDDAGQPSTLPLPELNPLLNPLLGAHMGRWAEVYFTSVPEKREEAVLELLRELEREAENSPQEENASEPPAVMPEATALPLRVNRVTDESSSLVSCGSCGRKNPVLQNFCGMCGARLRQEETAAELPPDDPRPDERTTAPADSDADSQAAVQTDSRPDLQTESSQIAGRRVPVQDRVPNSASSASPADRSALMPSLSPRRSVDHETGSGNYEYYQSGSMPTSNSYRVYIGAALALLVMALFYIAWRGKQATSEISAAPEPAAAEQPAPSAPTRTAAGRTVTPAPPQVWSGHVSAERGSGETSSNKSPAGPGAVELATAQNYLNGTGGKERNSEEAIQWLWKAVAKQNPDATLRLADLYLKGEGVAKNCDQARVLLEAAAHKGTNGAAEWLSQLQSFGCA